MEIDFIKNIINILINKLFYFRKLKVVLLILFLAAAGGMTSYFLYPRSVDFHVSAHNILNFNFEGDIPWMQYSVSFLLLSLYRDTEELLLNQRNTSRYLISGTFHWNLGRIWTLFKVKSCVKILNTIRRFWNG